ncbi:MAG: fumarylacetoacetate hydrolase family protein [Candidatus Cyclobacteriaceae bacterium M3_2C_046]
MKILAIGRNYVEHIEELNSERPEEPVVFFKPDTAVWKNKRFFYLPDFSDNIHYEVELVIKINQEGKNIQEKYASKYYDEIGIGIDFTARDIQNKAKDKGLPWALAKGFDNSAPVSDFLPKTEFPDINNINFSLEMDGEVKQQGNSSLMIYSFDYIIHYISRYITLKKGDLIFTGTPKGVGPVKIGNKLNAYIEDQKLLEVEVK